MTTDNSNPEAAKIRELTNLLTEYSGKVKLSLDERNKRREKNAKLSLSSVVLGVLLFFSGLGFAFYFEFSEAIGAITAIAGMIAAISGLAIGVVGMFERHTSHDSDLEAQILERVITRASQLLDRGSENFKSSFELEVKLTEAEMLLDRYRNK